MEFKLYYEGLLKSNGNAKDKHLLRLHFHQQLEKLLTYEPLKHNYDWIMGIEKTDKSPIRNIQDFQFTSIVNSEMSLYAELEVLLLKEDIFTGFGDLDNQLKTLLDGLRCPKVIQEIPDKLDRHTPLICLLEDDNLLSKIEIKVDRLLKPLAKNNVFLLINVKIKGTVAKYGNLSLIT